MRSMVGVSCFLVLYSLPLLGKDKVKIQGDMWCPYNCQPASADRLGFLVDLAKSAWPEFDVEYELTPWTRALKDTELGAIDGVIGAVEGDVKDAFYTKKPLAMSKNCFYTKLDSKWTFTTKKDLESLTLGLIKDYTYGDLVTTFAKEFPNKVEALAGDDALLANFKKLEIGRITAITEDVNVLAATADRVGVKLRNAGCDKAIGIYIPISKKSKHAATLNAKLETWMQDATKNGELAKLKKKYNMQD